MTYDTYETNLDVYQNYNTFYNLFIKIIKLLIAINL
jgi:hypothetical protein